MGEINIYFCVCVCKILVGSFLFFCRENDWKHNGEVGERASSLPSQFICQSSAPPSGHTEGLHTTAKHCIKKPGLQKLKTPSTLCINLIVRKSFANFTFYSQMRCCTAGGTDAFEINKRHHVETTHLEIPTKGPTTSGLGDEQ